MPTPKLSNHESAIGYTNALRPRTCCKNRKQVRMWLPYVELRYQSYLKCKGPKLIQHTVVHAVTPVRRNIQSLSQHYRNNSLTMISAIPRYQQQQSHYFPPPSAARSPRDPANSRSRFSNSRYVQLFQIAALTPASPFNPHQGPLVPISPLTTSQPTHCTIIEHPRRIRR